MRPLVRLGRPPHLCVNYELRIPYRLISRIDNPNVLGLTDMVEAIISACLEVERQKREYNMDAENTLVNYFSNLYEYYAERISEYLQEDSYLSDSDRLLLDQQGEEALENKMYYELQHDLNIVSANVKSFSSYMWDEQPDDFESLLKYPFSIGYVDHLGMCSIELQIGEEMW